MTPLGWARLGAWAVFFASCSYGIGGYRGRVLLLRGASEICGAEPVRDAAGSKQFASLAQTFLPLGNICRYTDGSSLDLVPSYVNPVVFALMVVASACCGLGLMATVRRARWNRQWRGEDGDPR